MENLFVMNLLSTKTTSLMLYNATIFYVRPKFADKMENKNNYYLTRKPLIISSFI